MSTLSPDQRRQLLSHPAGWIACGFGSGLSPVAPGTVGSLAALLPWWFILRGLPTWVYAIVVLAAFALGVWVSRWAVERLRLSDPGAVVWDEFVGMWVALLPWSFVRGSGWWPAAGFVLFRVFDIAKPWPVSWADRRVKGGFGVMLDDLLAGVYAALALAAIQRLL